MNYAFGGSDRVDRPLGKTCETQTHEYAYNI